MILPHELVWLQVGAMIRSARDLPGEGPYERATHYSYITIYLYTYVIDIPLAASGSLSCQSKTVVDLDLGPVIPGHATCLSST